MLECSTMNEELARLRTETCSIAVTRYSGIRVSQKAVHFAEVTRTYEKRKTGRRSRRQRRSKVYVMHGSEIVFRQIVLFTAPLLT